MKRSQQHVVTRGLALGLDREPARTPVEKRDGMTEAWSMLVRPVARTLALFVLWLFGGVTVALGQTPDFTGISAADRQAMEQTCRGTLLASGPAANLRCLSNQIEQIRQLADAITQPPKVGVDWYLSPPVPASRCRKRRLAQGNQPRWSPKRIPRCLPQYLFAFGLPTGSAVPQAAEPLPAATRRPAASDDIWVVLAVLGFGLVPFGQSSLMASKAKPCSNCSASTSDPSGVCDS